MKNVIKWVHIALGFKKLTPEGLVPFCTAIANELPTDADVPVSGSPVTMLVFNKQIADVQNIIIVRQNSSSKTLTSDQHSKVSMLINSTESIAHYVEITLNNKYAGVVDKITTIINRIGYEVRQQGAHGTRIFEVVETAQGSATLRVPSAGLGAVYFWRWSGDGKTWSPLRATHETTIVINALPSAVKIYFEFAEILPAGKGKKRIIQANNDELEWSDPITTVIP